MSGESFDEDALSIDEYVIPYPDAPLYEGW